MVWKPSQISAEPRWVANIIEALFTFGFCSNCPCFAEITVCFLFRFPPGDLKRKQREKTSKPRGFEQRGKAKAKKTGDFLGGCEQKGLLHVHSFASNFTYLNAQEALFPRPNPLFPKSFFSKSLKPWPVKLNNRRVYPIQSHVVTPGQQMCPAGKIRRW